MWNVWEQNQVVSKRSNLQITQNPDPPSECCAQPDTALQPMDVTESKTTHSHLSIYGGTDWQVKILFKKNTA